MSLLNLASLHDVSDRIRRREVSPIDVVEACLAQIESLNPSINAWITILADAARAQAHQAEEELRAGAWRGPLHGIPVAFKDMFDTAEIRTTAAFEHFTDRVPKEDAVAVSLMKTAGAIILGKTNLHTLGMGTTALVSAYGPVRNPRNAAYIAGGSSGGSAAAVATGMCYATIDTDAIGSTRLPAACCGVVGYKCTWGLIDNQGVLAGEPVDEVVLKLATVGIIARDVADTVVLAEHLAGPTFRERGDRVPATLRVGVVTNAPATPATHAAMQAAAEVFAGLGHSVVATSAPVDVELDVLQIDHNRMTAIGSVFREADVLVLPTLFGTVPEVIAAADDPQALSPRNTFFANYYGLPAVTVPCGTDDAGLPIGLQLVGKPHDDGAILHLANRYQQMNPWLANHPLV